MTVITNKLIMCKSGKVTCGQIHMVICIKHRIKASYKGECPVLACAVPQDCKHWRNINKSICFIKQEFYEN